MKSQWHAGKKRMVCDEVHRLIGLSPTVVVYQNRSGDRLFLYDIKNGVQAFIQITIGDWRDPSELARRLNLDYIQKLIAGSDD